MKKIILKTIYWIFISTLALIAAIGLTVMINLSMEEGGAPGYDPEAIFVFWLITTQVSLLVLIILVNLKPIINFSLRQHLRWRQKKCLIAKSHIP